MFKVKAKLTDGRSLSGNFSGTFGESLTALAKMFATHKLSPDSDLVSLKVEAVASDAAFKLSKPRAEKVAPKGKK